MNDIEKIRCLIIGSGPAGYTAAIYAGRSNLSPVLYEGMQPGGQLTTTTEIENFPGYPQGTTGSEMMEDLKNQALRFSTDIRYGKVTSVDFSQKPYTLTIDGEKTIMAGSIIIATGASAKYLGLEDEQKYAGMGVSACATCDGFFYRRKVVAVVGGGDTACEEAIYLSQLASKVYLLVRKPYLRASQIMQVRVSSIENIEILYETELLSLSGDNGVEAMRVIHGRDTQNPSEEEISVDGLFLAIGHNPNTEVFADYIELDSNGYIVTKEHTTATNVEGVFAAGDVADPHYRQAITAAGSGCRAAIDAERYLQGL